MSPRLLVFSALLFQLSACAPGRIPPPSAKASRPGKPLIQLGNAYLARIEKTGIELPYHPTISETSQGIQTTWLTGCRTIEVPTKKILASEKSGIPGVCRQRRLLDLVFRWFLPVRELGLFLLDEFHHPADPPSATKLATELAYEFLKTQPRGQERLDNMIRGLERCIKQTASSSRASGPEDPAGGFQARTQLRKILGDLKGSGGAGFDELLSRITTQVADPTAVMLDAALDVGFHVAAHLHLPDVAITLHDPEYIRLVRNVRRQMMIPDLLIKTQAGILSRRLNILWQVHRLVRVPALFHDFEDSMTAFALLLGKEQPGPGNELVRRRLDRFFLPLYPVLNDLSANGKILGEALVTLIDYEYKSFYRAFHQKYRDKWDWSRRNFRTQWHKEILPAVSALDPDNTIRQVVIVLSPALRRHGKSFRLREGIVRVAALLPENPGEMTYALLYAFHELCHAISDPLVLGRKGRAEQISFKRGEAGKQMHFLCEAAANQAMFESLGMTNPDFQKKFLAGMGNLAWLAESNLLAKNICLAGHELPEERLLALKKGLREEPFTTSREIYRLGLLVEEKVLESIRTLLQRTTRDEIVLDYVFEKSPTKAGVLR